MSSRVLIVMLLAGAALTGGCDRQSPSAGQANSAAAANGATAGAMPDEMPSANAAAPAAEAKAMVDRSHKGEAAPATAFADPQDKQVTLADFKGQPVLVNLWATWCAPCIKEMPTLDALAVREAGKIKVLTISQDLEGQAKVLPFFAKGHYKALQPYIDAQAALSIGYQANLPTTILYDATGHEVWRVSGGMDWSGDEAKRLLGDVG